jgi:hypothetical protein
MMTSTKISAIFLYDNDSFSILDLFYPIVFREFRKEYTIKYLKYYYFYK